MCHFLFIGFWQLFTTKHQLIDSPLRFRAQAAGFFIPIHLFNPRNQRW
ncbi:Uncharacterised protein [Vibrio cholerae]|nr:Uncharacterised protein [Vibrio cholerae]